MADNEYMNGFICGLAVKGVLPNNAYKPIISNNDLNSLIIDFKFNVQRFSYFMLKSSIFVLHDGVVLDIINFEFITDSKIKVYVDLKNCVKGIEVININSTLLKFILGNKVPSFSVQYKLEGLPSLLTIYIFDTANYDYANNVKCNEKIANEIKGSVLIGLKDTTNDYNYNDLIVDIKEKVII